MVALTTTKMIIIIIMTMIWTLWDENHHDFYMTPFCDSFDYKLPEKGQFPVFPHKFFTISLVQLHLKK
jgi:hypothetical protein